MSDINEYDLGTLAAQGGLIPDDLEVHESSDGELYVLGDDGTRYDVERHDDSADDDFDTHGVAVGLGLSPMEEEVFNVFVDANDGDQMAAIQGYTAHQQAMAEAHGIEPDEGEGYLSSEEAEAWFAQHPAAAADVNEFMRYYEAAGEDLDAGYELYSRHLDVLNEAAAKEDYRPGGSTSIRDALDDAYADGTLGSKKPYVHKRGPRDSGLDDALGEFFEDLSAHNAVVKQGRDRIRRMRRSD
jgi:hypothetical protein